MQGFLFQQTEVAFDLGGLSGLASVRASFPRTELDRLSQKRPFLLYLEFHLEWLARSAPNYFASRAAMKTQTQDVITDCFTYGSDGTLLPAPIPGQPSGDGMASRNDEESTLFAQIDIIHASPQCEATIDRVVILLVA
jgi:hypothetical protein